MIARVSRPSRTERITRSWPGRSPSCPKRSRSVRWSFELAERRGIAPELAKEKPRMTERRHGDRRAGETRRTEVRLAAVGDVHCGKTGGGTLQPLFAQAAAAADILLLAGDLT